MHECWFLPEFWDLTDLWNLIITAKFANCLNKTAHLISHVCLCLLLLPMLFKFYLCINKDCIFIFSLSHLNTSLAIDFLMTLIWPKFLDSLFVLRCIFLLSDLCCLFLWYYHFCNPKYVLKLSLCHNRTIIYNLYSWIFQSLTPIILQFSVQQISSRLFDRIFNVSLLGNTLFIKFFVLKKKKKYSVSGELKNYSFTICVNRCNT